MQEAKKTFFARLSLPDLTSLIPQEFQVDLDEYFKNVSFGDPAAFIGISFMAPQAPRAYQIWRWMTKVQEEGGLEGRGFTRSPLRSFIERSLPAFQD